MVILAAENHKLEQTKKANHLHDNILFGEFNQSIVKG